MRNDVRPSSTSVWNLFSPSLRIPSLLVCLPPSPSLSLPLSLSLSLSLPVSQTVLQSHLFEGAPLSAPSPGGGGGNDQVIVRTYVPAKEKGESLLILRSEVYTSKKKRRRERGGRKSIELSRRQNQKGRFFSRHATYPEGEMHLWELLRDLDSDIGALSFAALPRDFLHYTVWQSPPSSSGERERERERARKREEGGTTCNRRGGGCAVAAFPIFFTLSPLSLSSPPRGVRKALHTQSSQD